MPPTRFRELLHRAAAGDEKAREEIHRVFAPSLQRFVKQIVGPGFLRHTTVDEVCQETLLRVFTRLEDLPDDATPSVFQNRLYRNARWIIQTMARRSQGFVGESGITPPTDNRSSDVAEEPLSRTGEVTRQDELAWMRRLIEGLRPDYSEVIRLRLSGLEFTAIARQLGCGEDTARKRYSRAVDLLQERLRERALDER